MNMVIIFISKCYLCIIAFAIFYSFCFLLFWGLVRNITWAYNLLMIMVSRLPLGRVLKAVVLAIRVDMVVEVTKVKLRNWFIEAEGVFGLAWTFWELRCLIRWMIGVETIDFSMQRCHLLSDIVGVVKYKLFISFLSRMCHYSIITLIGLIDYFLDQNIWDITGLIRLCHYCGLIILL